MRIDTVSTSPRFKSNVKFVNSSEGQRLFHNKNFKELVNRIANNGETSTVVLMPTYGTNFPCIEQWIKDRITGKLIGYKGMYKKAYNYHPEIARKGDGSDPWVDAKGDTSFKALKSSMDNVDIYVSKGIDGKPHIGVSRVPVYQNIDFAEFRYRCAESNLPDNPIPEWMDKRLYKYLAPTSDSRVMLLYGSKYHSNQEINDLYKNEDFINCVEWLDKEFINKNKKAQIIINPITKLTEDSYFIGVYMIEPSQYSDSSRLIQKGDKLCWHPNDYKAYDKLKERIKIELQDSSSCISFPDLLNRQ